MPFTDPWNETVLDGAVHRGFQVDDFQRELKRAIRQRLEGEAGVAGSGLVTDFAGTANPKLGMARAFADVFANIGLAFAQDGRLFISTDRKQLFHKAAAADEILGPRMLGGFATLPGQPRAKVTRTAVQSIPNNAFTIVNWNGEVFDIGALHDNVTNNSRITVPANGDGVWLFGCMIQWADNATGTRAVEIRKGGGTIAGGISSVVPVPAGQLTKHGVLVVDEVIATDFVEVAVFQNSGAALDLETPSVFWTVKLW